MTSLAAELNAVVLHLRTPSESFDDHKKKIGAVVYYLPLIKNTQNLWILLQELSWSPRILEKNGQISIPLVLFAIDGISYACDRKTKISAPTVTPDQWQKEMLKIAYHLPPLFGLIIASALVNANVNAVPDLLRFLPAVCESIELLRPAAAACLMRAQWSYRFTNEVYLELPFAFELLDVVTKDVVFTQANLNLIEPAVNADIGGWSRLIKGLLLSQPAPVLFRFVDVLSNFVRTVVALYGNPEFIKQFFFGVLIQLEGVANQVLANTCIRPDERALLAINLLKTLQPLGFVVEFLGAQFESYQFVWNTCLDALTAQSGPVPPVPAPSVPAPPVSAVAALGESWLFGRMLTSPVDAGDLIFFFEAAEQLLPIMNPQDVEQLVLPVVLRFSKSSEYVSVFEAAHSVMLANLATHSNAQYSKSEVAVKYFKEVVHLFPLKLSAPQFRTAISAIMRAVNEDAAHFILNELFSAAKQSLPGVPLPPRPAGPHENASVPPTLRATLVSALLHAAADYCGPVELRHWLTLISPMVPPPFSPLAQQEREFLVQDFADVVTSLGNETSDVGIRWYFNEGWNSKL